MPSTTPPPVTKSSLVKATELKEGDVIILRSNPLLLMPVLSVARLGDKIAIGNERNGETLASPEMKFRIQH